MKRQRAPQHAPDPPPKTFLERFERIAQSRPDRIAFRRKTPDGYIPVTYGEAHNQSKALAIALNAFDLPVGASVAILSENRPEWVIAYLGIYKAGMVAVPLDTQISPEEWLRLILDCEAGAVFTSGALLPKLEAVLGSLPASPRVVSFDPVASGQEKVWDITALVHWASTIPEPSGFPECKPEDIATIIYTSGTTGTPKGVLLTHGNIIAELESVLAAIHANEDDVLLCLLPLQHVLASVINVLVPLYLGGQVVFVDTLKRAEILKCLQEAGITILVAVPQFFYLFHDRITEELSRRPAPARVIFRGMLRMNRHCMRLLKCNLGKILFARIHRSFGPVLRLFVSGGSAFDAGVAQDFHDMGFTILQGYGLTETTGACFVTRVENNVVGSVGPPLPGVDVKIDSPDDSGVGEILVRGPMVFREYFRNKVATEEAFQDGWLRTGDLGRLDTKGNLFVTGRKKEVIVLPNGKNIYPDELEAHYSRHPAIREIAVIGVFSEEERGERLHAVIVPDFDYLKANRVANAKEFLRDQIGRLSNQLPPYKRLMSYQIQSEPLPRTTTRKIKRLELKRLIEEGQIKLAGTTPQQVAHPQDAALLESAIGQEVVSCLRETYGRNVPIHADMNLELDLGFDSMERVELLSSLEEALHLDLPEDFGTEILTVGDLVAGLEKIAGVVPAAGPRSRQNWKTILNAESLDREESLPFHLTGTAVNLLKFICLKAVACLVFLPLLRLRVKGLANLPEKGPFIICPNHASYLDPFILLSILPYSVFRRMFFLGYSQFFQGWFMKLVARMTNVIPVDPDAHLLRAMKAGAAGLRHGLVLGIFPEGGRSFDGRLQMFKKGAAILSRELSVPIVPAAIKGTHEVWPRDSYRIRLHKVSIEFGKPLSPQPTDAADPYQSDTDRLRDAVADLMR